MRSIRSRLTALLALTALTVTGMVSAAEIRLDIESYDRSTLAREVPIVSAGHLVLFSAVREVNDELRSESMARLPVRGIGQLWEVSQDASREEARAHFRSELQSLDARTLYECEGRSCGRSNVWANRIFGESKLYGRDENQDYLVAVSTDEMNTVWLTVLYTVTRGNQREYVWLEQLAVEPGAPVPGVGAEDRKFYGPLIVPWKGGVTFQFEWSADDRRRLQQWSEGKEARVVLVSHALLEDSEPLEDAMERAQKAADSLAMLLAKSGVSKEKQQQIIVGPTVPLRDPSRNGNRIELLVFER